MKKRAIRIFFITVCMISIVLNIILVSNYNNAKESYIFSLHDRLRNMDQVLENVISAIPGERQTLQRNCIYFEMESVHLDSAMSGLENIRRQNISMHGSFNEIYRDFEASVAQNDGDYESVKEDLIKYQEMINQLLERISDKDTSIYNAHGELVPGPDYSLGAKEIIKRTNAIFKSNPIFRYDKRYN